MKKVITISLVLIMTLGISVAAYGSEDTSTGGEQKVRAKIPGPSWILVIPADQKIDYLEEKTDIVHADCGISDPQHIPANSTINAYLTHTGQFTKDGEADKTIDFTLNAYDEDVAVGTKVIVSQWWSDVKTNQCYYDINVVIPKEKWTSAESGKYSTMVTYTSSLVDELTDAPEGGRPT